MKTLFFTLFVLVASILLAQPSLSFQRCYGGTGTDVASKMLDYQGNGFVVFGTTTSNDGDVSGNHGGKDLWVFRNDSTGAIVWQKCYGGSASESFVNYHLVSGGGYIITGISHSNDGDVVGAHGGADIWVVKLDSLGNIVWQKSLGGSGADSLAQSVYDPLSGYTYLYSQSNSNDGDISTPLGDEDVWSVVLDSLGNIVSQNSTGSIDADVLLDVMVQGNTATYIYTNSFGLTVGNQLFNFGGGGFKRTADGGVLVEDFGAVGPLGQEEYKIEKFSSAGVSQTGYYYSANMNSITYYSHGTHITQNGFEIYRCVYVGPYVGSGNYNEVNYREYDNQGTLLSNFQNSTPWNGQAPACLTIPADLGIADTALEGGLIQVGDGINIDKMTFAQNPEWAKVMGGTGIQLYADYLQKADTSYWVLGSTNSNNGDVSGNHGGYDIWLTSLAPAKNGAFGYVWEDVNHNGSIDAADLPVSNLLLKAVTGANTAYAISQANGRYELNLAIGNYVVSAPNLPLYHTLQPATGMVSFANNNASVDSLNPFLLVPIPNIQDLKIMLTGGAAQPGFDRSYDLSYKNVGTQSSNATIHYTFNPDETFVSASPAPDTLTATSASWNVSNLSPSASGSIYLVTNLGAVNLGSTFSTSAYIYPFVNDQNVANNTDTNSEIVAGSFDPNDKLVSPAGNPTLSSFTLNEQYLTYTVRFQNTGNAPAVTVAIKDTLSHLLDITTLEVLSASHDFVATVSETDKLTITYPNIMLPDSGTNYLGSQGFIKFRIKPMYPVAYCEAILNKSAIYFDFNAPVITNEVSTFFLPDAPVITAPTNAVCAGSLLPLTNSNLPTAAFHNAVTSSGASSIYYLGNQSVAFQGNLAGNFQVYLQQSIYNIAGCTVSSAPFNIEVYPTPNANLTLSGSTTICQGSQLTLTAAFDTINTYSWYYNNTPTGTNSNLYQATQTGNYHLQIANTYGCSDTSNMVSVSANPSPTVSAMAMGSTSLCLGDTLLFTTTATAGVTYKWQKNGSNIAGGTNDSLFVALSGNYHVIVQNSYNCKDTSALFSVVVHNLPTVSLSNVGTLTFCDGNSVLLNANVVAGYSYAWKESGNPIAGANSSSYQATQSGTYTVTVTDSNVCSKTSLAKIVTVNPTPTVSAMAMGSTSLCQGDTLLFTATATPGVTYKWQKNGSNIAGGTNDSLFVALNGNYHVIVQNSYNCKDTSALFPVVVHNLPTVSLSNVGSLTFCDGNSVLLNANVVASYNYAWKESGNPIAGANASSYQATQSGTYTVTVTDSNVCSKTSLAKTVVVNPKPVVNVSSTGSIAQGNALLIATATPNVTFQWQKNNSNVANGANDSLYVTLIGNYRVIVKNTTNCKDTSDVNQIGVGIEQGSNAAMIYIYPNPAQEELFVSWESAAHSIATVSLTDITGKQVFAQSLLQKPKTEVTIPVADLAEGVYLLRVEANEAIYTEKIMIRR